MSVVDKAETIMASEGWRVTPLFLPQSHLKTHHLQGLIQEDLVSNGMETRDKWHGRVPEAQWKMELPV